MSSLLKRELEKEFAELEKRGHVNGGKSKSRKLVDQLPTTRHGIKKTMKRLKTEKSLPKSSSKKMKFSFLELQSKEKINREKQEKVELGVRKLLGLSEASKSVTSASEIVEQNNKLRRQYEPKSRKFLEKFGPKKKVEESSGTVFTEEDFEKFSREYFVNSKPIHPTTLVSKKRFEDEDESFQ